MQRKLVSRVSVTLLMIVAITACSGGQEQTDGASKEALFEAARLGDLDGVRAQIDLGAAVDATARYEHTALLKASGAGHVEVVDYLLDQGADPNRRETFFNTSPLSAALGGDHIDVAISLLRGGADERERALEYAIREGSADLARAAIESGPIYESTIAELAAEDEIDVTLREFLDRAQVRPDPAPPSYTREELQRFAGLFEGVTAETTAEIQVEGPGLLISIDDDEAVRFTVVGENSFRSEDGTIEGSFWGRAGTIEAFVVRREGMPPVSTRRSVAEPVGPAGFRGEATELAAGTTVNWPGFRGENASGIGDGSDTPTDWDLDSGSSVLWSVEIPGLGNSSPIVWGDRVFVTTAVAEGVPQEIRTGLTGSGDPVDEGVEHSWQVLALDKWTGESVWTTEVGRGLPLTQRHFKASQASSTPVTDGSRLVVVFPTAGLAALDLDGRLIWKQELGGLNAGPSNDAGLEWGFASSPVLDGPRAILQVDIQHDPYIAAWDLETGDPLWRTERDGVAPSWATPSLLRSDHGTELVTNGSTIYGYDPETGRELWSLGPNSELAIATPVIGDDVAYVSAGYPPVKPIYAVRAGTRGELEVDPATGSDQLVWSHGRGGAYMPTPILYRGMLYVVHHNGRLVTYDAATGTAIYKTRFSAGGTFTGSPVAVNGKLYLPTEDGQVYVIEAGTEYRELAVNEMGEPLMATPAVSEGILLFRTPKRLIAVSNRAS